MLGTDAADVEAAAGDTLRLNAKNEYVIAIRSVFPIFDLAAPSGSASSEVHGVKKTGRHMDTKTQVLPVRP